MRAVTVVSLLLLSIPRTMSSVPFVISDFKTHTGKVSVSHLRDHIEHSGYEYLDRPNLNGPPVNVSIQMGLYSLRNVDKKSFTFNLAFSCIATWNDDRLSTNESFTIVAKVSP